MSTTCPLCGAKNLEGADECANCGADLTAVDQPFNPVSVALGAEATFVARTHDMDRKHMIETFRRAREHRRHRQEARRRDAAGGRSPPGHGVRRDLPELQRLQRRRLRCRSGQGEGR